MKKIDEDLKKSLELIVNEDVNPFRRLDKVRRLYDFVTKSKKIKDIKILTDSYLKKNWIDAHKLKEIWVWKKNISRYDLYKDTRTWEIFIFLKWWKWNGIATWEYIK